MKRELNANPSKEGVLPLLAPLANPYVPFQTDDPPKYELKEGLVRGTLFPGLDLPFMGQVNKNLQPNTPLTELQTLSFAIQELTLYLDTHRNDVEALEFYRSLQKLYAECRDMYEAKFGPLTSAAITEGKYTWLDDPWPWEYAKNREV